MKLKQPTLFRQSLGLFVALIVFGQISASLLFFHFSQRPRMEIFTAIAARQVATIKSTLAALPQSARDTYIEQVNQGGAIELSSRPPATPADNGEPHGVAKLVLRLLAIDLADSGISIGMTAEPRRRLIAHWQDQGGSWWVTFPDIPLAAGSPAIWISVSVLIGLLSLAGALLIQQRLHRPLNDLVHAARRVGAGTMPEALKEDGAREIATLARGFNRMVNDLRDIEQQRAMMLAGVSHDLRTPLTKMRLALGILEGSIEPDLQNQMVRSVEEMDRLLGQFLDFARVDTHEAIAIVDLRALALECIDGLALDGSLFDTTELRPAPVTARPQMMRRLLVNLLDNAIKYGRLSQSHPAQLRSFVTPAAVHFVISDAGPGFGSADTDALVRPFVRGAPSEYPGSGLGLSIVARIVAMHQGELKLCESPRAGGEVQIELPLHPRAKSI